MVRIRRYSDIILQNYFLLMCVSALVLIVTGKGTVETVALPIAIYINAYFLPKNRGSFDYLIWLIFCLSVVTWIVNDYDQKPLMIFRCFLGQIAFMFAYFVGKAVNRKFHIEILDKSIKPLAICSLVGIYFYFRPPGWYLDSVISNTAGAEFGDAFLEFFRLKSIFNSAYYMSYACALVGVYIIYKTVWLEDRFKYWWVYLTIIGAALLLTMMRGPIFCFFFGCLMMISFKSIILKKITYLFKSVLLVSVFFSVVMFLGSRMDSDQKDFLKDKIESVTKNSKDLAKRTDLTMEYRFIGDGVGRYASYALELSDNEVLADSEYKKIMGEYGYLGLLLFSFLLLGIFVKCLYNLKKLMYEFFALVMLALCMVGADPLSTVNKHCLIFWMIIGYVSSYNNPPKSLLKNIKK